ncbi:choice-of-anchor Q domain-containing protein [Streptomyces sp. NPDC002499]
MHRHAHAPRHAGLSRTTRQLSAAVALLLAATAVNLVAGTEPAAAKPLAGRTFYVDAQNGNDQSAGTSTTTAWKSLSKLSSVTFQASDTISLRRGQTFTGQAVINGTATTSAPITVTAYGTGSAPTLSNPTGWNMLQVQAPHVTVENLRFADGVVFDNADGTGITGPKYRLSGAVAVTDTGTGAIVRNNEFTQVGVGVKTYATDSLIQNNNFHDLKIAFRGMDSGSETSYGAIGVSVNNSDVRVSGNKFTNCRSTDSPYGADGGAVEIEGFDHDKNDITIDHNVSTGSQGFLEVTETNTADVDLLYNVSDDYQQFLAFDTTTHPDNYLVAHNTILRDRGDDQKLFAIYYYREDGPAPQDSWLTISSNIIEMSTGIVLFDYLWPHDHNLINASLGDAPGAGDILAAPKLTDVAGGDYTPQATSPAVDNGGPAAGTTDLLGNPSNRALGPDIGAIERQNQPTAGTSVVQNGGFETATSITGTSTPWYSEGSLAYGVDNGTGTARTGSRNAWIASSASGTWGAVKQTVTVTPNKNYRLTFWVRNSGNIDQGWLGVKTTGGTVISEVEHGTAPAYSRVVLTLNSGSNSTLVLHSGYYSPTGSAWQRIDDVALQPLS